MTIVLSIGVGLGIGLIAVVVLFILDLDNTFFIMGAALASIMGTAITLLVRTSGGVAISLPDVSPTAVATTAGSLALITATACIASRVRLRRTVNQHASRLLPVLADISDHLADLYPSEAGQSTVVDHHLEVATSARSWQSRKALLELRHGAVKATEDVRVVLRKAPQDGELRAKLNALVSVRGEILDTVHMYQPPRPRGV